MKAFWVHIGAAQDGCVVVFAPSAGKAKATALERGPWLYGDAEFTDMRARRLPRFDKHCTDKIELFDSNNHLPEPFFLDDEAALELL